VPGEGRFGALIKAVCMDLHSSIGNTRTESCEECFLLFFREQMRIILWQKPSSLFILLDRLQSHIASVTMQSLYCGLVERVLVRLGSWVQ
jgi:hypothetical protein